MTNVRRKLGVIFIVAIVTVALAGFMMLAGCSSSTDSESESSSTATEETDGDTQTEGTETESAGSTVEHATTEATSYEEWIEQYPYIYESFCQFYYTADPMPSNYSHYGQSYKDIAYAKAYDEDSEWSKVTGTCIACKTSAFNEIYEEYGDAAYSMSKEELGYDGLYFECTTCHTDSVSLTLEASLVSFKNLSNGNVDNVDQKVLVCGQCHNTIGQYGYYLNEDWGAKDADPYRYGTTASDIYQAYMEDGLAEVDEATGAELAAPDYSTLELFINGNHYSLGLTCVDCHATETTDENGNTFTSHNTSSSPLDNDKALEKCLTCHTAQGIESADDMVTFYRDKEAAFSEEYDAAQSAFDSLTAALTDATSAGTTGEAIDQARADYSEAYFMLAFARDYNHDEGYRVAHNYADMSDCVSRAQSLAEDGLSLLS